MQQFPDGTASGILAWVKNALSVSLIIRDRDSLASQVHELTLKLTDARVENGHLNATCTELRAEVDALKAQVSRLTHEAARQPTGDPGPKPKRWDYDPYEDV